MPQWNETTRRRLRSSVLQMLAQAGYIENTRSLKLQNVHVADQVLPGELFAKFQTGSYADPVDAVFKSMGVQ